MAYFNPSWIKINAFTSAYLHCKSRFETSNFDKYRNNYDNLSFSEKKKLAKLWLKKYPEQMHFNYGTIESWIKETVPESGRIIEIGGWRGDLAMRVLASFGKIEFWHNYDLIQDGITQKCNDPRYKLITLGDYLWNSSVLIDYNALIATHTIEHLSWNEMKLLIQWIPDSIKSVLFEAPLPNTAENHSWYGDHSSHVLEKGWNQVSGAMLQAGFSIERSEGNTYIYKR